MSCVLYNPYAVCDAKEAAEYIDISVFMTALRYFMIGQISIIFVLTLLVVRVNRLSRLVTVMKQDLDLMRNIYLKKKGIDTECDSDY